MKKFAFPLALGILLLVISIGFSAPLGTDSTEVIKDKIYKGEVAEFNVTITNNQDHNESVYITTNGDWDVTIRPYILELEKYSSATVYVRVSPPANIAKGLYGVRLAIDSEINPAISTYKYIEVEVLEDISAPKLEDKVDVQEEVSTGFLSTTHTITIKNIGRTIVKNSYSIEQQLFESYFTAREPEFARAEGSDVGKKFYWDYTLMPNEEKVITYTTSYQSLLAVVVLFFIALILLGKYYATDFKVEKKVYLDGKKGEPKAVRVKLSVTNLTSKEVDSVILTDLVPPHLKLSKDFGTLKPDIIESQGHNLKVLWKLGKMSPKETKVVSYEMKSRIAVLGRISLPPAMLSYKKNGKGLKVFSDILTAKE